MKIRQILSEIIWEEQYTAIKAAARFPGAWIHFSQVPKLGINPSKTHHDPPGIYFYPCRWLSSYEAGVFHQYGVQYPYYFICRIAPSRNSIDVSRMTQARARSIASRNGWLEDFDRVVQSGALKNKENPMPQKLLRRPGGAFYAAMDYLVNVEGRQWLQLLRGVDVISDHGAGIISQNEIHQVCVINSRLLTILEQGENKDEWNQIHARMMQQLAQEFGGKFYYKHKIPTIEVVIDGKPIKMEFDAGNWGIYLEYFRNGQWVRDRQRYENPSEGDYENVLQSLRYKLTNAAKSASAGGSTTSWNQNRIYGLFDALMYNVKPIFKTYQHDDEVSYGAVWDTASIYSRVNAKIVQNDGLEVSAEIAMSYKPIAEVNTVLPAGTDIQQAAGQILNQLATQIKTNLPNADWSEPRLQQVLKFKLPFA